jgi:protein SCO1
MATASLRKVQLGLWIAVAVMAVAALTGFLLIKGQSGASGFGGGSYSLTDSNGQPVTEAMLKGQPSLLFFGFTHCPEVCPTTLAEMAGWFEALGPDAANLKAFFVTVDPERDTSAMMKDYVGAVSDRITGVSGTRPEIDKIMKAWAVFAEKVPTDDGEYTMNHTATVYLVNSRGEFQSAISYREDSETALKKIRALLKNA